MPKPRYIELPDGDVELDLIPSEESIEDDATEGDRIAEERQERDDK